MEFFARYDTWNFSVLRDVSAIAGIMISLLSRWWSLGCAEVIDNESIAPRGERQWDGG